MRRILSVGFFLMGLLFLNSPVMAQCTSNCTFTGTTRFDDIITKGPWIDVRAFGAAGDGVIDDTLAIQAAIDHGETIHGIVYFPPGSYKITSRLIVKRNVDLVGTGVGFASVLLPYGTDAVTIFGSDMPGGTGFRNVIKGLLINMTNAGGSRAIAIDSAYTIKIQDLMVYNAGSGGGISIANAGHITVEDVSIYGLPTFSGTGVLVTEAEVNFYNPDIESFFHGLRINGAGAGTKSVHVHGGHFERNAAYGIRLEAGASYNTFTGVQIDGPASGYPIGFWESSHHNTFIGSRLRAQGSTSAYQDTTTDRKNVLFNSQTQGAVTSGIQVQYP